MKARVLAGYYLFSPVFGYRFAKVEGHGAMLIRDGEAANIVRQCFDGMASGRFRSVSEVRQFLDDVPGVPRDAHGEMRWTFVTEMLRRSLYARLINVERSKIKNLPVKHEALITYETWARVQDVLPAGPWLRRARTSMPISRCAALSSVGIAANR